jgi:hypothetical protein
MSLRPQEVGLKASGNTASNSPLGFMDPEIFKTSVAVSVKLAEAHASMLHLKHV